MIHAHLSRRTSRLSRVVRAAGGLVAIVGLVFTDGCSADPEADGPPNPDGKDEGAECTGGSECKSLGCNAGKCTPFTGGNPTDGTKNGDETDADCGGLTAPKCVDGKGCVAAGDCASGSCVAGTCKAPSPTDGAKNSDETDVDCGGTKAPKCAAGKGCATNADCTSEACSYEKKCVEFKSCIPHFGGDTCGAGETGTPEAKHESCCTTVTTTAGLRVGKYGVTAGRMRAFVERFDGNLQQWVATAKPTGWNAAWTAELPASMDEALGALGPGNKRGCAIAARGGRTFWQPPIDGDTKEKNDFPKDVLDEKALNCVSWYMAQAICAFDGGRLPSSQEITALRTNNNADKWPWGGTPAYKAKGQMDQLVHSYSYQTPNPPKDMRVVGADPLDQSFFMAPPGRRPLGANKLGVNDVMGNMLPWVNDSTNRFAWTASWENHTSAGDGGTAVSQAWNNPGENDGYYAIGVRCVFQ